ncbi:MAG: porin family protein [Endomicrobia bacterium]|nr:porin family protein [Endomicrobiia bacterium]MCL2506396.1 porin family protein [Endomicrobiia bacterium]
MKRMIAVICILIAIVFFTGKIFAEEAYLHGKIGTSIKSNSSWNDNDALSNGFMLGVELVQGSTDWFLLGFGASIDLAHNVETYSGEYSYNHFNLYGLYKLRIQLNESLNDPICLFGVMHLGPGLGFYSHEYYSRVGFNAYGAIGGGIEFKRFIIECLYTMNLGTIRDANYGKQTVSVNSLQISLGYKFNL